MGASGFPNPKGRSLGAGPERTAFLECSDREEPRVARRGKKLGAMVSEETATPIGSASLSRG
jgi:hypothetical protein